MLNITNTEGVQLQENLFRGFGDPARLNILQALCKGSHDSNRNCGCYLYEPAENTSNRLGCLRECGLVAAQHQVCHVTYRLSEDRVAELLVLAESLLVEVARGVYECANYSNK